MGGECVAPHVGDVAPTYSRRGRGPDLLTTHVGGVAPTYDTPVGRPHVADDTHKHPKQQAHTTRIRST